MQIYSIYKNDFFNLLIIASNKGISRIIFSTEIVFNVILAKLENQIGNKVRHDNHYFTNLYTDLSRYFGGEPVVFNENIDLSSGTEFQHLVWKQLLKVKYGQVKTYGQIAKDIDRPTAVRAVGAANGKNPVPLLVPCHRIIGADGKLIGYGPGLDVKEKLLRLEGVII